MRVWIFGFFAFLLMGFRLCAITLGPVLRAFAQALPYLRVMAPSVLGFGLVYILIVVWFATLYFGVFMVAHAKAYANVASGCLHRQFLSFSLATVTALGESPIRAASLWTTGLCAIEWLVCRGWTVIVFAAVMGRVTEQYRIRADASAATFRPTRDIERDQEIGTLREELQRMRAADPTSRSALSPMRNLRANASAA